MNFRWPVLFVSIAWFSIAAAPPAVSPYIWQDPGTVEKFDFGGSMGFAVALPKPFVLGEPACGTPPTMCEPGATRSGLFRPSAHGPWLEKLKMSFALLASES